MLHVQINILKNEPNLKVEQRTLPLTIYKKNCYTVVSDGKMKLFLSFSPSVIDL